MYYCSPLGKVFLYASTHGCRRVARHFQEKMLDLMRALIYVRTYLDDLLVITKGTFDDHLVKIEAMLTELLLMAYIYATDCK